MKRAVLGLGVLLACVGAAAGYVASVPGLGRHASGARLQRMQASPQWRDGKFRNPEGMWMNLWGSIVSSLSPAPQSTPADPVPHDDANVSLLEQPPASGLRVTWFGHSSVLLELDGTRLLIDPIWSARASPVSWAGPRRYYPPLVGLAELPHVDTVVVSHDHYDHLDMDTVTAMADLGADFVVPLGIGAHLAYWGIPEERIHELDWWQQARIAGLDITATPARHASGRIHPQADGTLWAGYAFVGPSHRAFYSGDTGFHATLRDIGERLGPFDVTLVESGQYNPTWPDWHLGPEQAVELHRTVRGGVMIPVHWGLFTLAPHGWTEPVERVLAAARCRGVTVVTPRPGESIEPLVAKAAERWWPSVPWQTADQAPVIASRAGDRGDLFPLPACAAP